MEPNTLKSFLTNLKYWLSGAIETTPFVEVNNMMRLSVDSNFCLSPITNYSVNAPVNEPIILIQQFYINTNPERQNEIQKCLLYNVHNQNIDKIYLLNERFYTDDELRIKSDKIIQVVIGRRIRFSDVFEQVKILNISGYIVFSNSDIFFDASLTRLTKSQLIDQKKAFCLNRFNYDGDNRLSSLTLDLFGRPDCQDTWIYHSNFNGLLCDPPDFDIEFGIPGCDNRLAYLLMERGFKCHNEPYIIRTYHYHRSQIRNYDGNTPKAIKPYYSIFPVLEDEYANIKRTAKTHYEFNIQDENRKLADYIREKTAQNQHFIIPRIVSAESELAVKYIKLKQNTATLGMDMDDTANPGGNNGLSSVAQAYKYAELYMRTFARSETFFCEAPWSSTYSDAHYFIEANFEKKQHIWSRVLDLGLGLGLGLDNKLPDLWTFALKGQRILIISDPNKGVNTDKYRGLFPECEITFLQLSKNENWIDFFEEYDAICDAILAIKDRFDIAVIAYSGSGFTNMIASFLFDIGKSGV